jgi:hypothetical protein
MSGSISSSGIGDANRNVLIAVSANLVLAALGTAGVPGAREAFLISGFVFGVVFFGIGLLSDIRSVAAAQRRHRPAASAPSIRSTTPTSRSSRPPSRTAVSTR